MIAKGFRYDSLLVAVSALFAFGFIGYTYLLGEEKLALVECIGALVLVLFVISRIIFKKARYRKLLKKASHNLDFSDTKVLTKLPYPAALCDEKGFVSWCNDLFIETILNGEFSVDYNISKVIGDYDGNEPENIKIGEKYYYVYAMKFLSDGIRYHIFNFIDNTELKETEARYLAGRPYIIMVETDNIDDARSDLRDSEKAEIKSRIDLMIEDWCEKFNSVSKRISDDRLIIATEKSNIDRMTEDKFSILSDVRNFTYKDSSASVTLSIGVSGGDSIKNAEKGARKALDMATGRGGDQVALRKEEGEYEFFGGVSAITEKYSKTRARGLATRLAEEIKASDNVLICGHRNSDFDAVGAAAGVAFIANEMGVPVHICVNKSTTLALPMVDYLEKNGFDKIIIDTGKSDRFITKNTLAVLVDSNVTTFSECPELFVKCSKFAIIDHHRLSKAELLDDRSYFHEPSASSTCEMISEYVSYVSENNSINTATANALLAGIMLDTKNFAVRAGVRTFQAAAYLREKGADLVLVRKMFSISLDDSKLKNRVVIGAEKKENYAISTVEDSIPNARVIASQAADELLNVSGVEASFVIFAQDGFTCISSRSLGSVNVQLIMEAMGGGGHQTMAATKMENISIEDAKSLLADTIEKLTVKEKK